jgi:PPK2 family polyphosphate:nucleotide phosphotransferase
MADKKAEDRLRAQLRIPPGSRVKLSRFDPSATYGHRKESSKEPLAEGLVRLTSLQDRIYAESKHPVLIVLQGIDAAGKDGTIRHVMNAFNPMGCPVTSFKVPTSVEAAHDYLWRVHQRTPARGEIAIFNRSHYEDVLVVRVHNLVPRSVWSKRFAQINAWERMLVDEGTTILKFFLLIDAEEQRQRLQDRVDSPAKRWKFKTADLAERKLWDQYTVAFEEALSRCSTEWAPWYVIPANRNWFRDLAVAEIVGDTLDDLKPAYPPGEPGIESITVE